MARSLVSSFALLTATAAATSTRGGDISAIVDMLKDAKAKLQEEHESAGKTFQKTKCFTEGTTKKNEETIDGAKADVETWTREIDAIGGGGVFLTDEQEVFAAKIAKKEKELDQQESELDNAIETFKASKSDMELAMVQLNDAAQVLVFSKESDSYGSDSYGSSFSQMSKSALSKLRKNMLSKANVKNLSSDQVQLVSSLLQAPQKQAPEAYKSQTGSIGKVIENLKQQYQGQLNDSTTAHKADEKARRSDIKAQQQSLNADKQAMAEGNREAAAREKRTKQLQGKVDAANELVNTLTENNAEMTRISEDNLQNWSLFNTDFNEQMSAIDDAIQILWGEDSRDHFNGVNGVNLNASFVQIGMKTSSTSSSNMSSNMLAKMSAMLYKEKQETSTGNAIDHLKMAISTMIEQLQTESSTIDENMQNCSDNSRTFLENAKQAAEQVDGFSASVAAMQAAVSAEAEEQKGLKEEIAGKEEEITKSNSFFEKKIKDLNAEKDDVLKGRDIVGTAIERLESRKETSRESSFHEEVSAVKDPLAGVILLLKNIEVKFGTEAGAKQTEIENSAAEKQLTEANLQKEIADMNNQYDESVAAMADAETVKNTSSENKQSSQTDLDAAVQNFNGLQQGCDYWLMNGPARKSAISDEITALNGAKAIFSKEGLGMAAGDGVGSEVLGKEFDSGLVGEDQHEHMHGNVENM